MMQCDKKDLGLGRENLSHHDLELQTMVEGMSYGM